MDDEQIGAEIRTHASYYKAGSRLRSEIRAQIALAAAAAPAPARAGSQGELPHWQRRVSSALMSRWSATGAGFALGLALALAVIPAVRTPPVLTALDLPQALDAQLLARHVHALRDGPLIEVATSDRHTVKPWFQGRVDYAPTVLDLAPEGFPLQGGRVEQVAGAAVAVLVYGHRQHIVNVYVWPASRPDAAQQDQRRGFNVLHWSDGAMQFWAISDMDAAELGHFAQAWQAHSSARPG